jgi:hypothetical protein
MLVPNTIARVTLPSWRNRRSLRASVAQKEVQQEQHDREVEHGIECAQKEGTAESRRALHDILSSAHQPALQLRGRHAGVRLQPVIRVHDHGKLLQVGKGFDVRLLRRLLQLLQKSGDLGDEIHRQGAQGQQDHDRCEQGEHGRGESRAPQLESQPLVQRKQEERQERGPRHGAEVGIENQEECVTQDRGEDERKHARIESRLGQHDALQTEG